jgi:hypothetical protein
MNGEKGKFMKHVINHLFGFSKISGAKAEVVRCLEMVNYYRLDKQFRRQINALGVTICGRWQAKVTLKSHAIQVNFEGATKSSKVFRKH